MTLTGNRLIGNQRQDNNDPIRESGIKMTLKKDEGW